MELLLYITCKPFRGLGNKPKHIIYSTFNLNVYSVVSRMTHLSGQVRPILIIGGVRRKRERSQRISFQKCCKRSFIFFLVLVARHWDAHIPTFTLNFPQMFGLTLLHSLNWYTTDKHSQRGRASHGTNVQSFWTKYTAYKYDATELSNEPLLYVEKVSVWSAVLESTKSYKPSKAACSWHEKNIVLS